jgi:hypothetical protein
MAGAATMVDPTTPATTSANGAALARRALKVDFFTFQSLCYKGEPGSDALASFRLAPCQEVTDTWCQPGKAVPETEKDTFP